METRIRLLGHPIHPDAGLHASTSLERHGVVDAQTR